MSEKLHEIDTSAIEKLVKIKEEQDRLVSLSSKADEMKGTVDETVYRKVRADYQSRETSLEKEAAPLKAKVRGEYEKLCSMYDQLKDASDQARRAKEELEFRHAVGEFDKTQLAETLKEPEQVLQQRLSQLGDADKLKAQFLAAFHSEEELEVAPHHAALEVDSELRSEPESKPESKPEPEIEALGFAAEPPFSESTIKAPFVRTGSRAPAGTLVVQEAKLVIVEKGEPFTEFRLEDLNYIGRAEDNHIPIPSPTASRKHALVTASTTGFTVKDLESRTGTFVNEKEVTECVLTDGDRIKIGGVELVFHSP